MNVLLRTPAIQAPPANGAVYPAGTIGNSLRQAAQIIKAGLGTRCIFVNVPGAFDTHANQLPAQRARVRRASAQALAAFAADLGGAAGRRGADGDDRVRPRGVRQRLRRHRPRLRALHDRDGRRRARRARATAAGRALERSQLYQERDLAVTTDFRDVFAEVARAALGVDASRLYPGYTPGPGPGAVA